MKKIFILLLFIAFPLLSDAQPLNGLGTSASPYNGIFEADKQWNFSNFPSGKVYINGDVTIDNELLTIAAGMSIIFTSTGADLIITGTGQLDASGAAGNMITFTADFTPFNGSYGETGERWGHIYFNAPSETNQSKIDFCTLEYGDVHTFTDYQGYGGAIYSKFSNLIVSNSIIRNNYGDWGGGLFIGSGKNPTIRNCLFYNNKSDHGGGGVYCWNSSSSLIENCIFDNNQCLEPSVTYYTGGGLAAQSNCSIKVLNCTFVNNTSTRTEGQGILLHASPNSRVINTIFWGSSDKQIYCYGTTSGILINCAYRGITYSTGTPVSPIVLNSSNSASDGPNFSNPAGFDWSILFISPCRDAGINTYAGVTIPSTDYINNPIIYTKDIGAYEFQYSRWKTTATTTDWGTTGNWDGGIPASSIRDVVIPSGAANYPSVTTTQDFIIGSGKQMIIEQGAKLTLDVLTNNGILKLESNASGISSLITNAYSGNDASVQLYLTGGEAGTKNYRWHYISTPVSTLPVSTFTPVTPDIVRYYDSRVSTDLVQGWVAQDGWIYATGSGGGPTFTNLTPGLGYDFYDSNNNTFTFSGQLNTADSPMTLDYAGGANNGFNLLGNPFMSGLDWDYIIDPYNPVPYPSNTSKGVYFTRDNALCSYIGGVGSPLGVNGFIPPMQGFFTKTGSADNTITLAAAARTHTLHARYKGTGIIPLVRLSLTDDTLSDETVVRFDVKATANIDNDFDAPKIFYSTDYTSIYSTAGTSKLVINGLPFPETSVEIPIGVNLKISGIHAISTTQLEGLDNYNVYLTDNVTGFTSNLKTTPVLTFSASAVSIPDRFILKVSNMLTGTEDPVSAIGGFNIYHGFGFINIQTIADEWDGKQGSVTVLDLSGKTIADLRNTEFSKNSVTQVAAPVAKGLYVVELKSGVKRYVGKVVVR